MEHKGQEAKRGLKFNPFHVSTQLYLTKIKITISWMNWRSFAIDHDRSIKWKCYTHIFLFNIEHINPSVPLLPPSPSQAKRSPKEKQVFSDSKILFKCVLTSKSSDRSPRSKDENRPPSICTTKSFVCQLLS